MFMNQGDIEWAAQQHHECPNVRKGVHLLLRLMEAVNAQSDGWAYWKAAHHSVKKLVELLQTTGNINHGTHGTISDADFRKAVSPIRSMVTRQKRIQSQYGNTFEFDVNAALTEVR